MEYTKQLILSCLLNICQKVSPDGGKIPKGMCVLWWRGSWELVHLRSDRACHLQLGYFSPPRRSGRGEVQRGIDRAVHPRLRDASDPPPRPLTSGDCGRDISCKYSQLGVSAGIPCVSVVPGQASGCTVVSCGFCID